MMITRRTWFTRLFSLPLIARMLGQPAAVPIIPAGTKLNLKVTSVYTQSAISKETERLLIADFERRQAVLNESFDKPRPISTAPFRLPISLG